METPQTSCQYLEDAVRCRGLSEPAVVVSADAVVVRGAPAQPEILVAVRGPGRWQEGLPLVAIGGLVDPRDASVHDAVRRELAEELPGLGVRLDPQPFLVTGPRKHGCYWDPRRRAAVRLEEVVQEIPVLTLYYLAHWQAGVPTTSGEVQEPRWVPLVDLLARRVRYAFDHAEVLAAVARLLRAGPLATAGPAR